MSDNEHKLNDLLNRINELSKQQFDFHDSIRALQEEVLQLKQEIKREQGSSEVASAVPPKYIADKTTPTPVVESSILDDFGKKSADSQQAKTRTTDQNFQPPISQRPAMRKPKNNVNWEDFLGRNLISKIGIVILVLGVGYLTKFAIDNDLINPLTRIILGYVIASSLVFLALKWKEKYESLSAVVLTGSLGLLYFITYAAYYYYQFFPQSIAFVLMVFFTVFGMIAAHIYNRKALAYISIIGAFAIPLLLSNNTGNYKVLFTYLLILNIGIILFGIFKKWLGVSLGAFIFTWIFYAAWYYSEYQELTDFYPSFLFITLFFGVFYWGFMRYYTHVVFNKQFKLVLTALAIALNAFIYYGLGYYLLEDHAWFSDMKGLYTLANAIIHFAVFYFVRKHNSENKTLFYVVSGLVITFITLAVPVQLDGNWVTIIWFFEALILLWIGLSKQMKIFELFAYPILAIGALSLLDDWDRYHGLVYDQSVTPFLNIQFLTNVIITIILGMIAYFSYRWKSNIKLLAEVLSGLLQGAFVLMLFLLFTFEINNFWDNQEVVSEAEQFYYTGVDYLRSIWIKIYAVFFIGILVWLNRAKLENIKLKVLILFLGAIGVFIFLTQGLYVLSEIREMYFENITTLSQVMLPRYVGIAMLGGLVYALHVNISKYPKVAKYFEIIVHIVVLWVLSSELIHWLDLNGSANNYRFGLTILWGVYALIFLIYRGIKKPDIILRIGGFVLFGFTLIKLFIYDLQSLETIEKTVVFIAVGILLLIVSYLYNRNKTALFGDEKSDDQLDKK